MYQFYAKFMPAALFFWPPCHLHHQSPSTQKHNAVALTLALWSLTPKCWTQVTGVQTYLGMWWKRKTLIEAYNCLLYCYCRKTKERIWNYCLNYCPHFPDLAFFAALTPSLEQLNLEGLPSCCCFSILRDYTWLHMIKHDYTTYTLSFHCTGWLGAGFTVSSWMIDGEDEHENETENDDDGSTTEQPTKV